jgi:hypothetical protein
MHADSLSFAQKGIQPESRQKLGLSPNVSAETPFPTPVRDANQSSSPESDSIAPSPSHIHNPK